jgi:hypothetical protein
MHFLPATAAVATSTAGSGDLDSGERIRVPFEQTYKGTRWADVRIRSLLLMQWLHQAGTGVELCGRVAVTTVLGLISPDLIQRSSRTL